MHEGSEELLDNMNIYCVRILHKEMLAVKSLGSTNEN